MICKNCGIEVIVEGSKFCNNCGSRLTREENPKSEETDRVIRLTPKEEPDGVAYYDSRAQKTRIVKKAADILEYMKEQNTISNFTISADKERFFIELPQPNKTPQKRAPKGK